MAEPRRVFIDWDYGARGIWWVLTRQEKESPAPPGRWSAQAPGRERGRAWGDLLTSELLADLQDWNDAWGAGHSDRRLLQQLGRDLAIRVQDQLGTDGWEVLYKLDGQVHRVHPPGRWPLESWTRDLLGYAPRQPGPDTE